jgi:hypothetical protein
MELIQIARAAKDGFYDRAYRLFQNLNFKNKAIYYPTCHPEVLSYALDELVYANNSNDFKQLIITKNPRAVESVENYRETRGNDELLENVRRNVYTECTNLLFKSVETYKDRSIFTYNVGVCANTRVFEIVKNAKDCLSVLNGDFATAEDLKNYLLETLGL